MHIHIKCKVSIFLILWLGGLCTDADDSDNYARWTNHDYIGSLLVYQMSQKTKNILHSVSLHLICNLQV